MTTAQIPVGVEDVAATVANFRLHKFKKRLDEMRQMLQNAQSGVEGINTRAMKNLEDQRKINTHLEECKRKREELLNPKPATERPRLYVVK